MIRCLMNEKDAKRTLANKNNPERAKSQQNPIKTNYQWRFSIRFVETEDNENKNDPKWCYEIASFENNHNHARNTGLKAKVTDDIELWIKENINPNIMGPISLQKLLIKIFKKQFSIEQLSYLLHKLFHKQVPETDHLIKEVLQKNSQLEYKIGTDQVKFFRSVVLY